MTGVSFSTSERQTLLGLYSQHAYVFNFVPPDNAQRLPRSRARHMIDIDIGSANPIRVKPYRALPSERKVLTEQVQDLLKRGVIQ